LAVKLGEISMTDEEERLRARVNEAESAWETLKKQRRDYVLSHASDASLDLIRPYLSAGQQESLRQMDREVHEASQGFYALRRTLEDQFPPPLPDLPPAFEIDPYEIAQRTGRPIEEIQAIKARINHTHGHSGVNADKTLRQRWQQDGVDVPDLNDPKRHYGVPRPKRELIKTYGSERDSSDQ
jgi:hypothetical protein